MVFLIDRVAENEIGSVSARIPAMNWRISSSNLAICTGWSSSGMLPPAK